MKILAIDTATNSCSVAIVDAHASFSSSGSGAILSELTLVTRQTHSKHLMGMIQNAAEMAGISVSDVDGFAVTRGPGSFTGLRIGISVVKGLALATDKPVVAVSTLDALAFQIPFSSYLICTLIDARKKEVYSCRYRFKKQNSGVQSCALAGEQVLSPEDAIADIHEPCLFIGNGALLYQQLIEEKLRELAFFVPSYQHLIHASTVAYLSFERFEKGDTDDIATLAPQYIRKSDAELGFGKKVEIK